MFRTLLKILILDIISVILAVIILIGMQMLKGEEITIGIFFYGLLIGGGQALIPFGIFLLIYEFLIISLIRKESKYLNMLRQFAIGVILMVIVIVLFTIFDFVDSPRNVRTKGIEYIYDYNLFMVFTIIAIFLNYQWHKHDKIRL